MFVRMNRVIHCIVGERKSAVGWLRRPLLRATDDDDDDDDGERRTVVITIKNMPTDTQTTQIPTVDVL